MSFDCPIDCKETRTTRRPDWATRSFWSLNCSENCKMKRFEITVIRAALCVNSDCQSLDSGVSRKCKTSNGCEPVTWCTDSLQLYKLVWVAWRRRTQRQLHVVVCPRSPPHISPDRCCWCCSCCSWTSLCRCHLEAFSGRLRSAELWSLRGSSPDPWLNTTACTGGDKQDNNKDKQGREQQVNNTSRV